EGSQSSEVVELPSKRLKVSQKDVSFCRVDFLKERDSVFPCAEEEVYQFLKVLERDKAPKSRIASVMEALNFTLHVVGVSELQGVCQSRRCKGLCITECFTEAKHAPPLTVDQLSKLHAVLEEHADPWTRLFAGAALVCAYARLQSRRHRFLHAVAPALGIRPYGHLWKQCREQLGVKESGACPFMPAPDAQGQPTIRALDSDEATAWLRMLFSQTKVCDDASSKSLKATVISWAAKRGVEPLSLQRLGYHASGGIDIVYSRDAQAPLVMLVERLLREVAEGSFKPDDTRSGRIVTTGAVSLVQPVQPVGSELAEGRTVTPGSAPQARLPCKDEHLPGSEGDAGTVQVDSDSEGLASEGESFESSDEDEGQPIALVAQGHLVPPGFDVWRHDSSGVAHLAPRAHFKNLFACGRKVGRFVICHAGQNEVSPDGSLHSALLGQGIKNFRQLAFSIGTPRVEPSAAQYLELATQIFGASPSLGSVAMLRDLHFESTTYVIQVFKEHATSDGTDTQVKRLPMPERAARAEEQQRRLSGVSISGELQPSYSLIDKCNTMYESGALVWLAPSVCSKRDAEVSLGVNEKSPVVHLEKDSLKLPAPAQKIPVDLSSPLCLQWAWQRRGIALDQCSLLTWKVHEEYVHRLLNFLTAPVPAGWMQVKPEQLIRADKEVWTLLAREVPPPYKTLADGTKPLDQPFKAMAFDQRIQVWLSPVLNTGAPTGGSGSPTDAVIPEIPPHVPKPPRKPKLRKKASKLMPVVDGLPCCAKGLGSVDPGPEPAPTDPPISARSVDASLKKRCDILELFDALPKSPSPRQSEGRDEAFSAGSFVHGGVVGLRNNTSVFAGAVELICKFLRGLMKGAPFTSVTILDQCMSSLHVDSSNEPESWNLIVPLSDFSGGNLWYECEQGREPCPSDPTLLGKILRLELGPQWLSDMLVVELCCGIGGISKACGDAGFQTLALDVRKNRCLALQKPPSLPQSLLGIRCVIENPTHSVFWVSLWASSDFLTPLIASCPGVQVVLKAGALDDTSLPAAVQRQELSTARLGNHFGMPHRKGTFHLLSRHLSTWGEVQAEKRVPNVGVQCKVLDPQPHTKVEVFRFGIPLPPEKFLQRAVDVGHPHAFASSLEPTLKEVVDENISGDEVVLSKKRLKFVAKWTARAKELDSREAELQQSLPEHVRKILKGKRLLLWKEMIEEYDLPDKGLIDDMMAGFPLCGWLPKSDACPAQVRRPEFSGDTLKHLADGLNKTTREKMAQRQSPELEKATWDETLAELQSEWIWQAPDNEVGVKVYARRFGLDQHGKIRVIDDCSCCGLNATVGVVERLVVHAIDRMASMLAYALEVSRDASASLCGRTYDLKSAYKQFRVSCKDRDLLRMLVNCPHRASPVSVGVNSLPFGAIGSVAAFLRISNSIWMIGTMALRVLWTAYFDVYSVVSKVHLKKNTAFAIESLFKLLGLTYAREGKKAPEFAPVFNMLGLVVDVSQFGQHRVSIGHTEKRVAELHESLDQVLTDRCLSAKLSERSGSLRHSLSAAAVKAIGSVGAVLYNNAGCAVGAFGSTVPQTLLNRLLAYSKNPIYELELLPVLLSLRAWGHLLRQGQVVSYVDNEAAKSSLIRSSGATEVAENIVEAIRLIEDGLQIRCWFSRVPSASNPADDPSRLHFEKIDPAIILDASAMLWDVLSGTG
ncbi:unnamed protein product, partial [Symbiodinium necroappetens]